MKAASLEFLLQLADASTKESPLLAILSCLCNLEGGLCESSNFAVSFCNVAVRLVSLWGFLQEMATQQPQSTVYSLLSLRKPVAQQVIERDISVFLSDPPLCGIMHCCCFSRHFSVWLFHSTLPM